MKPYAKSHENSIKVLQERTIWNFTLAANLIPRLVISSIFFIYPSYQNSKSPWCKLEKSSVTKISGKQAKLPLVMGDLDAWNVPICSTKHGLADLTMEKISRSRIARGQNPQNIKSNFSLVLKTRFKLLIDMKHSVKDTVKDN